MTPLPYLKYYVSKNPAFGKSFDSVETPSVEEWRTLFGYEPTKVNPNYEDFARNYVERKTQSLKQSAKCEVMINKVGIIDESDIKKTEEREDFVRWIGS
jgi:hypothetical protein